MITSSTGTLGQNSSVLTLKTILEAIKKLPEDPVEKFMREKGCDPRDGWVMVVPPGILPSSQYRSFVSVNQFVDGVYLFKQPISLFGRKND